METPYILALLLKKGSTLNAFRRGVAAYCIGCVSAGKINSRYSIRFIVIASTFSSSMPNGAVCF